MRILFLIGLFCCLQASAQKQTFYIGTYTGTGSKGIYTANFNTQTGEASLVSSTDSGTVANPSFLALSPNGKNLYAVNETGGDEPGTLSAFALNQGKLQLLNKLPTSGDHPCYVSIDRSGKFAAVGNYSGGNVSIFSLNEDGSLKDKLQTLQHEGRGANKERQEKAHVHAAVFSPDSKYLFVPDLGTDKVNIYRFHPQGQQPLKPAPQPYAQATPGSGPRHFTFHPNGKLAYLMEELSGMVSVFAYNDGRLRPLQRISSHPKNYKGTFGSADIHLSEDGKFLYASNRGDANSIAIFLVGKDGILKWVNAVPSGGVAPRNFVVVPGGKFVLVANQQTDNVVVFKRNEATGMLTPTGTELKVPRPVCLVFAKN